MADQDLIERLWAQRKEEPVMTREEIVRLLRPRVVRSGVIMKMYLGIYLGMLLVTLVLQGINLAGYRGNPVMLAAQAGVTAIVLSFVAYAFRLGGRIGRLDVFDEGLAEAVRRRLAFYRGEYGTWLLMAAVSVALLAWSIYTLVDNSGGTYRINKPAVFIGVNVAMFAVTYAALMIAHRPFVSELRAVLEDLEGQMTGSTAASDARALRWRRWLWGIVLLLTVFLLLGVVLATR